MKDEKREPIEEGDDTSNRPYNPSNHHEGEANESGPHDAIRAFGEDVGDAICANTKSNDKKRDTHDRITLLVSLGSFLFVIVYTIVTVFSVYVTEKSNRAFIATVRLDSKYTGAEPPYVRWWVGPLIENSGNTPTVNLRVVTRTDFRTAGDQTPIDDPDDGFVEPDNVTFKRYRHERYVVAPHSQALVGNMGITTDFDTELVRHRKELIFVGAIRYRDVFPYTSEHVTKYCYSIMGMGLTPNGEQAGPIAARCPYWNCSDDECDEDKRQHEAAMQHPRVTPVPKAPQ